MKIIEKPEKKFLPLKAIFDCSTCDTRFEFEEHEATHLEFTSLYRVKCPKCGKSIVFDRIAFYIRDNVWIDEVGYYNSI